MTTTPLPPLPKEFGCANGLWAYYTADQMCEYATAARADLEAENNRLRTLLAEAADDIESWGAYASDYFQKKHDLAGCVAKYRAALENKHA